MLKRFFDRRRVLWLTALLSIGYALVITVLNLSHIRTMPEETRVTRDSLQSLEAAGIPVKIIERPASMVKELIENALDAGATSIDIEVEKAGVKRLKVTDNGHGILKHYKT